jgi:hypothetical protein
MGTNNEKVIDDISNSYKYREGEYTGMFYPLSTQKCNHVK